MSQSFVRRSATRRSLAARLVTGWLAAILVLASLAGAVAAEEEAAKSERMRITSPPKSIVFAAAFSPDGKLLAVACYDKSIIIYDASTGQERMVLRGHSE